MGLISRVRNLFEKNKLYRQLYWMWGVGQPVGMDDNLNAYVQEGYNGNPDVFSIINKIAVTASQVPIRVCYMKDDKKEVATDHEALEILSNPNPSMIYEELIQGHYIYKFTTGNTYWYGVRLESGNNAGKIQEIHLMPSQHTEIVSGGWTEPVRGYKLTLGDQLVEYTPDEVKHFRFFNPDFDNAYNIYGLSPVKVAANIIDKQNQGYLAESKNFANNGPPFILMNSSTSPDESWTSEQQEKVEEAYKNKYSGSFNAGKPMISGSKIDVVKLGISPADLNIIESTRDGRRVLCNVLGGVPSEMFNDKEASTYNNLKEMRKVLYTNVIIPNNNHLAKGLSQWILPGYSQGDKKFFFEFDYSNIMELQEDLKEQIASLAQAWWFTPNQRLEMMGRETVDEDLMDTRWIPAGLVPMADMSVDVEKYLKDIGY